MSAVAARDVVEPAAAHLPWTARLHVDQEHPFYFDHPLDHVPGMLLVAGLLDLARAVAGDPAAAWAEHRLLLSLSFPRFCELTEPTALQCAPSGRDAWALRAEQAGLPVCEGTLAVAPGRPGPGDTAPPAVGPAPAHLVHRVHDRNVMVGELSRPHADVAEAAVLTSDAFAHCGDRRAPEEIIEATRQLCIMLGHVAHGRPADTQVVWLDVTADLPGAAPRDEALTLRWRPSPPERGGRASFPFALVTGSGREVGTITCRSHTMSRRAYEKIRFPAGRP
ncbi:AfsA-related hotdog domain-containing protein [Catellatospora sp. TT07R-123]|uniref:AfsA-related hotdog domain-containing protein n=1 Tax=Catellatospora sp. TT07R-123 TaxID=2733863 RepID=UPI001BB2F9DA|nr:AfsA-related hotdog domain-containing protein [Catellatospora sp. TT07R-123]